jgi:hypothetical protein
MTATITHWNQPAAATRSHSGDFEALRDLGVSPRGKPKVELALIEQKGVQGAFDGSGSVKLTRRQTITWRRLLSEQIGIRSVGAVTASANQARDPSWRQIRHIVNLARGATA